MTWNELVENPVAMAIAVALVILVLAAIVALVVTTKRRRRRRDLLQRRFGAEYERTVKEGQSRREAEDDLDERRRVHSTLDLRTLTADEREHYRGRFEEFQASFVDAPEAAVRSADDLIDEVAQACGYRQTSGVRPIALVSVDHPGDVAAHHRGLSYLDGKGRADTEDLRQALLSARRLLEQLVGEGESDEPGAPPPPATILGLEDEEREQREQRDDGHQDVAGYRDGDDLHDADRDADDRTTRPEGGEVPTRAEHGSEFEPQDDAHDDRHGEVTDGEGRESGSRPFDRTVDLTAEERRHSAPGR